MTKELATTNQAQSYESALIGGDLSQLNSAQRLDYYKQVCSSLGVNPLTKPFDYIKLSGRLTLYAKKDATDQLRKLNGVSIYKVEKALAEDGTYTVTAYARDRDGREDVEDGVVNLGTLQGDALCNAKMKAMTKAKRRVTLSIVGLGWLDETEIETIPTAQVEPVDIEIEDQSQGVPGFDTMDDFLYQLSIDFDLDNKTARKMLKELGYTGFPKNGDARQKSAEMYLAIKDVLTAQETFAETDQAQPYAPDVED